MQPLTTTEANSLWTDIVQGATELEAIWNETSPKLWEFQEREGFKAMGYKSMKTFLSKQKQCSTAHLHRMLDYARAQGVIERYRLEAHPDVKIVDSERSYRPLSKLEAEEIPTVVDIAVGLAESDNDETVIVKPMHLRQAKTKFRADKEREREESTDKVEHALKREEEFRTILHQIQSLRLHIRELAADDEVNVFFRSSQRVDLDLMNVFEVVRFASPYRKCPYCEGGGCRACHGRGWVNKEVWTTSPQGQQERRDKLAKDRAERQQLKQAEVQLEAQTVSEGMQRENVRVVPAQ